MDGLFRNYAVDSSTDRFHINSNRNLDGNRLMSAGGVDNGDPATSMERIDFAGSVHRALRSLLGWRRPSPGESDDIECQTLLQRDAEKGYLAPEAVAEDRMAR